MGGVRESSVGDDGGEVDIGVDGLADRQAQRPRDRAAVDGRGRRDSNW